MIACLIGRPGANMESGQAGRIDKAIMDALEEGQLSVKLAMKQSLADGEAAGFERRGHQGMLK